VRTSGQPRPLKRTMRTLPEGDFQFETTKCEGYEGGLVDFRGRNPAADLDHLRANLRKPAASVHRPFGWDVRDIRASLKKQHKQVDAHRGRLNADGPLRASPPAP
jgi:hypothetical protein